MINHNTISLLRCVQVDIELAMRVMMVQERYVAEVVLDFLECLSSLGIVDHSLLCDVHLSCFSFL